MSDRRVKMEARFLVGRRRCDRPDGQSAADRVHGGFMERGGGGSGGGGSGAEGEHRSLTIVLRARCALSSLFADALSPRSFVLIRPSLVPLFSSIDYTVLREITAM